MKQVPRMFLFAALLLTAAACHSAGYRAADAAAPEASVGYLGDVTNGITDNASRGYDDFGGQGSGSPLAGAFFNDGDAGDVRGRTENDFANQDLGWVATAGKGGPGEPARQDPAPPAATERLLIQTGQIRVEVPRAEDAGAAFLAKVEGWGGYLQRKSGTTWMVRVPADRFDDALAAARAAGRVLGEVREANDVTEEFVDLGIRVDNARRARDRLLEVLAKAEKVEEILAVERELRRLTEEIERMEGRLKFLRDQVAMSTLAAEFVPVVAEAPEPVQRRQMSRFNWINRVGPRALVEAF